MDWFSHFFEGLFFLSPSRWMVIAPLALIMCWIGKEKKKTKKKKKKKKKEESASTAIENRSLWESTYCYSALSPITQVRTVMQTHKHTLSFSLCNNHTLTCKPMSEPMTEALITVIARCREDKKNEGRMRNMEAMRELISGAHAPILASVSAVAADWEEG